MVTPQDDDNTIPEPVDMTETVRSLAIGWDSNDGEWSNEYWLRIGELNVGGTILGQRIPGATKRSRKLIEQIIHEGWDPFKAIGMQVRATSEGVLQVLEGQNRTTAALKLFDPATKLLKYTVLLGLTDQRAAELLRANHDEKVPPTKDDIQNRDFYIGEKTALELSTLELTCRITISSTGQVRALSMVKHLLRERGLANVKLTMDLAIRAFGKEDNHITESILGGLSYLLKKHLDMLNLETLVRVMREATAEHIVMLSRSQLATSRSRKVYLTLASLYNNSQKRKVHRITLDGEGK